jgi:hypothetical protein
MSQSNPVDIEAIREGGRMKDKSEKVLNLGRFIIVVMIGMCFGKWMKSGYAGVFMAFTALWLDDCIERAGLITIKATQGGNNK